MSTIAFIKQILKEHSRRLLLTLALLFVLSIFQMSSLLTLVPLIDLITKPDLNGASSITMHLVAWMKWFSLPVTIYSIMILVLSFMAVKALLQLLLSILTQKIKYDLIKNVLCGTYDRFFNANWNFFVSNDQGTLGNTFIKETNSVGESFGCVTTLFVNLCQLLLYFAVAFSISWQLSLIVIILSIIMVWPFMLLGKLNYKLGRIALETANQMFGLFNENMGAAKIIIGFGEQKQGIRSLEEAVDKHVAAARKVQAIALGTPIIFQPASMAILFFSVLISRIFLNLPLSELTVVLYSFYSGMPLIASTLSIKNSLLTFFPAYQQVNKFRLLAENAIQPSGDVLFEHFDDQIVLNKINFSYPGQDTVLRDIDVIIPKGKMIAFVGKSGVGKSTLIDLLLRFYEPTSGSILIDGVNLKKLDVLSWRHKIGYVPQDAILFNMSVRENLRWAKENATDEEISHACEMANVDDFIQDLPKGLDTIVGDRGVRLSGGQRQRVALARAILRKPEIMILDEATSSLDSHSEKLIQESIENISHKTTTVIIAHRLSTIVNADCIYVIEDGTIIEKGSFSDLCANKGHSYELAKIQGMI